jgi:hypothetical protein
LGATSHALLFFVVLMRGPIGNFAVMVSLKTARISAANVG